MSALHRLAGTLLVVTLGASAAAAPAPASPPKPAAVRSNPGPAPSVSVRFAADALYAARARRLAQSYLRLRLLELRAAELERVRTVIERHLGAAALFAPADGVESGWNDTRGHGR